MYSIFNTSHYTKTQFCVYTRNLQCLMSAVEVFLCVCVCVPPRSLEYSHLLNLSQPFHLCTFPSWLKLGLLLFFLISSLSPITLTLACVHSTFFLYRYSLSLLLYWDIPSQHPQWPFPWPLTSGVNARSHLTMK